MAEPITLDEVKARRTKLGRHGKYPWGKWLDGQVHVLTEDDFPDVSLHSFRVSARQAAERRGLVASIVTLDNGEYAIHARSEDVEADVS